MNEHTNSSPPGRVRDQLVVGDNVEIRFKQSPGWIKGEVIAHQHPGIWVRTENGASWFVTNNRHIRKSPPE